MGALTDSLGNIIYDPPVVDDDDDELDELVLVYFIAVILACLTWRIHLDSFVVDNASESDDEPMVWI